MMLTQVTIDLYRVVPIVLRFVLPIICVFGPIVVYIRARLSRRHGPIVGAGFAVWLATLLCIAGAAGLAYGFNIPELNLSLILLMTHFSCFLIPLALIAVGASLFDRNRRLNARIREVFAALSACYIWGILLFLIWEDPWVL